MSNDIKLTANQTRAARAVGAAIVAAESKNGAIVDAMRKLAKVVKDAAAIPAVQDAVIASCPGIGEGTAKKYKSQVGAILRATVGGWDIPDGVAGLNAAYAECPKGTGQNKGNAAPKAKPAPKDAAKPAPATGADIIRALFGHTDETLEAAVRYAVENEAMFVRWAQASAAAAAPIPAKKTAVKK